MVPVYINVRVSAFMPIVEVIAESPMDISLWIKVVLQFIDKGEKAKGKLLSSEPQNGMKANTVYFSMIFESKQKAVDFAKSLSNR